VTIVCIAVVTFLFANLIILFFQLWTIVLKSPDVLNKETYIR